MRVPGRRKPSEGDYLDWLKAKVAAGQPVTTVVAFANGVDATQAVTIAMLGVEWNKQHPPAKRPYGETESYGGKLLDGPPAALTHEELARIEEEDRAQANTPRRVPEFMKGED